MRFMMMVTGDSDYEAGRPPSPALMAAIGKVTEESTRSGALVETGGLLPSSRGARIRASRGRLKVTDGPFTEAKEIVGGYAILRAGSKEEAIELGRRFLQAHVDVLGPDYDGQLEIREMFDPDAAAGGD